LYILGLQIELNFVPLARCSFSKGGVIGGGVEFFYALKCAERWFFDIYIQGSKKIQLFRAESEINRIIARWSESFSYQKNLWSGVL
jgi:hypothetical protein